ncbi:hypothetical protein [Klebsiella aerogenes]|uniref:hypothetical protein n=1 Tax=Klebsiella aerogenes TaxID=548 RepID=UPI0013A66F1F|nr:hypothetical protein [Klebsiella aerogenes]HCB2860392.1 hypothetical protein [Klebsiella aerogenes]HCB2865725.1 hypothetical protein [Klebsiella aerogenes]HCB2881624.1 hypothetical protein [Klebsiella aerogenes]HCB3346414.1 hypothetical protein [Klebsiella aerogenes]HCM1812460.1 hypothetical protein [Klebsiella aerogenes]
MANYEVLTITDTNAGDGTDNTVRVGLNTSNYSGSMKTYTSSNFEQGEVHCHVINDLLPNDDDVIAVSIPAKRPIHF